MISLLLFSIHVFLCDLSTSALDYEMMPVSNFQRIQVYSRGLKFKLIESTAWRWCCSVNGRKFVLRIIKIDSSFGFGKFRIFRMCRTFKWHYEIIHLVWHNVPWSPFSMLLLAHVGAAGIFVMQTTIVRQQWAVVVDTRCWRTRRWCRRRWIASRIVRRNRF